MTHFLTQNEVNKYRDIVNKREIEKEKENGLLCIEIVIEAGNKRLKLYENHEIKTDYFFGQNELYKKYLVEEIISINDLLLDKKEWQTFYKPLPDWVESISYFDIIEKTIYNTNDYNKENLIDYLAYIVYRDELNRIFGFFQENKSTPIPEPKPHQLQPEIFPKDIDTFTDWYITNPILAEKYYPEIINGVRAKTKELAKTDPYIFADLIQKLPTFFQQWKTEADGMLSIGKENKINEYINLIDSVLNKYDYPDEITQQAFEKVKPELIEQKAYWVSILKLPISKPTQLQPTLTDEQRRDVIDKPLKYKYNRDKPDYLHTYLSEIRTSFDLNEKGTFGAVCLALYSKKIFHARINFKALVVLLSKYWNIEPPKDKRPNKYTAKRDVLIRKYEILERKII
jgi:hypothetical protein